MIKITLLHCILTLSDYEDPALCEWVHGLGLTMADKKVFQQRGQWLTANHIQAANKLLQKAFPRLQDTHHLSDKGVWNSSPECFVQIIFIKHGHWACLSNKFSDKSIELFDSMHTVPTGVENGSISRQASCIVKSSKSKLVIDIIGVQKQYSGDDCGLCGVECAFLSSLLLM